MALGSDNPFPSILFEEHVDPATPPSGHWRLFVDTDNVLKLIDDAGTVTAVGGSSGSVATDAIWDAAGDLVQGTGANTSAKLSAGTAGKVLTSNGAAAALTWETPSAGGGVDNWYIAIDPRIASTGHTNWNTFAIDSAFNFYSDIESGGSQNDEIYWDLGISAGTWDFVMHHNKASNRGIYTVSIDGSSIGTIDGYAASPTKNVKDVSITGVSIAGGKRRLKLKMATKNASASSYFGTVMQIALVRTA